jgi:hypothetical protein
MYQRELGPDARIMTIRRTSALFVGGVFLVLSVVLSTVATASPGQRAGRQFTSSTTHSALVQKHHPKKHHKHHKAKPEKAARTTPTAAEVQSAIKGLKNYVHSIFSPSASQVAELGNDVCTAFDQGQSAAHIEATMLQKVQSLPLTTVLPGAAQYVVRTEVKLYCPGYKSRIGS